PSVAFGLAAEWIARGRTAARAHLTELAAIADSVRRMRGDVPPRRALPRVDSVLVRGIQWTPVSPGADGIVRGTHGLVAPAWLTLAQVQRAVARLYSTGRFDQVSFRLVPAGDAYTLWFDLTEGNRDVLGVGVRYDTPKGAAALASVTVSDWITSGSVATASARLGGDQVFDIRDVLGAGPNARFTQTYRATSRRTTLPQFRVPTSKVAPEFDVQEITAAINPQLGSVGELGLELAREWTRDGAAGADSLWAPQRHSFTSFNATFRLDTYDQSTLPTDGVAVLWRGEFGVHDEKGATFTRHVVDAQAARTIGEGISLLAHAGIGNASGAALPLDKHFLLGGSIPSTVWPTEFVPFLGLPPQSRIGNTMQLLQGGIRAHAPANVIISALGNIGGVFNGWPARPSWNNYVAGGGVSFATVLPVGLASLTIGSLGFHTRPVVEISAGSVF
ncbi:MAG: hypothetical protein ACREPM_02690, partial [Gemmatimonadaceae bacterium]